MRPSRYRVEITQSVEVNAHRTDDAMRDAMSQLLPDVAWQPDVENVAWAGDTPDNRRMCRYHVTVEGRGTVVVTVVPVAK